MEERIGKPIRGPWEALFGLPNAAVRLIFALASTLSVVPAQAEKPPFVDYCQRVQQEIQGKKHGFLAGNLTYYVGGFHASWNIVEHETLGLTHPFYHDLRSRGVGLLQSRGKGDADTGRGNDFWGWEFYKDTRVLYGSVVVDGETYEHPVPQKMYWRPDRMICDYEVNGVTLREEKFIAANDAVCTSIRASKPVTLQFSGQSFFGRHSQTSTATIRYDEEFNALHIVEGGTTKCRPETDGSEHIGPIMYQGMSTVITASKSFAHAHRISRGKQGQCEYEIELACDRSGISLVWAMHDDAEVALQSASSLVKSPYPARDAKTREMNRQLNDEIPWFRCSDPKFEEIYYFLWSLYLMYYIDVQKGWEQENHTQTAVNNFLGMHRYDATFQIKVGAWLNDKSRYAHGNVLTWKHLFRNGHYRRSKNGMIALADNKGTTWHSGVYGMEHSEHVLGAWQIYQHSGDREFLRACYEDYFREVFYAGVPSFFSNHFEVAETLEKMARLTGHAEDVGHWRQIVRRDPERVQAYFRQRWEANGHENYFGGPKTGMLMTTGFWHLRSRYFPRNYAQQMVTGWALDRERGFYGEIFPRAMALQSMKKFATKVDHSFGYTPDTAYFMLSGMFRQRLGDPAWRLTLKHLLDYNYSQDWQVPVAPEAYTRGAKLFGDQYSNFNAGKILLFLEGLAGIEYSLPDNQFYVHDTMPADWEWLEVRIPLQLTEDEQVNWTRLRIERHQESERLRKTIEVSDSPLQIRIDPWLEGRQLLKATTKGQAVATEQLAPGYGGYRFSQPGTGAKVALELAN